MKQQPIIETQKAQQHSTMVEPSGLAYCMVGCVRQVYRPLRRLVSTVSLNPRPLRRLVSTVSLNPAWPWLKSQLKITSFTKRWWCYKHLSNQCDIFKVMKVVHGNWSHNHFNWSDRRPSMLPATRAVLAKHPAPFLIYIQMHACMHAHTHTLCQNSTNFQVFFD